MILSIDLGGEEKVILLEGTNSVEEKATARPIHKESSLSKEWPLVLREIVISQKHDGNREEAVQAIAMVQPVQPVAQRAHEDRLVWRIWQGWMQ